jgi:MFS family permease
VESKPAASAVPPVAKDEDDDRSWRALFRHGHRGTLLTMVGGVGIHSLSALIVATLIPLIVRDIGGVDYLAWSATLYLIAAILATAAASQILAQFGSRKGYRIALSLFVAGSLVCCLAPNMAAFLLGRAIQGCGGGLLSGLAYGTIRMALPDALRPRALVLISAVMGSAALLGPAVGALFGAISSWRAAFLIDVPIGLALVLCSERYLPAGSSSESVRPPPFVRLGLLTTAALVLSIAGIYPTSWSVPVGLLIATALLWWLLREERTARPGERLFPRGAYDPRTAIGAISAMMVLLSGTPIAVTAFLPYLLLGGHAVPIVVCGYIIALHTLGWTTAAIVTGKTQPEQARRLIGAAPIIVTIAMLLLLASLRSGSLSLLVLSQVLLGGGIGIAWAHMGAFLMRSAQASDRLVAAAFIPLTQQLALLFGSALAGLVANVAGVPVAVRAEDYIRAGLWLFGAFSVLPVVALVIAVQFFRLVQRQQVAAAGSG